MGQENICGSQVKVRSFEQGTNDEDFESVSSKEDQFFTWKDEIQISLDKDMKIKLLDFGNACWKETHFTQNIQTREYRGIETILGFDYEDNCDIWSLACMIYELLTNNYLFRPKDGSYYL